MIYRIMQYFLHLYDFLVICCILLTCVGIMVSVQCSETFAIVPCERVSSIAMVPAHPQLVGVPLRPDAETGILCKCLASRPVFQRHQELVGPLVSQPVDVFQA